MFTTGQHVYAATALAYALAALLVALRRPHLGFAALLVGTATCWTSTIARGWLGGVFIPQTIFEGTFLLPCCLGLVAIVVARTGHDPRFALVAVLACAAALFALWYPAGMIPPTPAKRSWLTIAFMLTEVTAHALFYTGAILAAEALWRRREADAFHSHLVWGFVLYSVAQVVGAWWCMDGWGTTFRWSTRHLNSAGIWLLYAGYLHLRFLPAWGRRGKAWFAVAAASIVLALATGSFLHEARFPRVGG